MRLQTGQFGEFSRGKVSAQTTLWLSHFAVCCPLGDQIFKHLKAATVCCFCDLLLLDVTDVDPPGCDSQLS